MDQLVNKRQAKSSSMIWILKTIVSIGILSASVAFAAWMASNRKPPANRGSATLVPTVNVFPVEQYSGDLDFIASGSVVPYREIKIATEVGGMIMEKSPNCEAGKYVHAGDLLFQIDRQTYQIEVDTLKAEELQSKNMIVETDKEILGLIRQIEIAKKEMALLKAEYDRNSKLKDVVSNTELDQSQRGLLTSESQLSNLENTLVTTTSRRARMESALELSKKKLERAELNLSRTKIESPVDGVIVRESVEQGEVVVAGTQLLLLEDTQRAEVACNLSKTDLNWIRQNASPLASGQSSEEEKTQLAYQLPQVEVNIFDAREPEIIWKGILERVDGIGLDDLTKTVPVRIGVDNPVIETPNGRRALVRGMFVKCQIVIPANEGENADKFLTFPATALRPGGFVWVADGRKLRRVAPTVVDQVRTRRTKSDGVTEVEIAMAIVRADGVLKIGEMTVVSPLTQPTEGATVRLVDDPLGSDSTVDNKKNTPEELEARVESTVETIDTKTGANKTTPAEESTNETPKSE